LETAVVEANAWGFGDSHDMVIAVRAGAAKCNHILRTICQSHP
jgi:hypothetical protein